MTYFSGHMHFKLYDILSYMGSEITFVRQVPTGVWNIFMVARWKMWSPNSVKKFFVDGETQKRKVFQDYILHENTPTPERSHKSDSTGKGIKISCSKWRFRQIDSSLSLETWRNIFLFLAVSTKPFRSHAKRDWQGTCFCQAPTI